MFMSNLLKLIKYKSLFLPLPLKLLNIVKCHFTCCWMLLDLQHFSMDWQTQQLRIPLLLEVPALLYSSHKHNIIVPYHIVYSKSDHTLSSHWHASYKYICVISCIQTTIQMPYSRQTVLVFHVSAGIQRVSQPRPHLSWSTISHHVWYHHIMWHL